MLRFGEVAMTMLRRTRLATTIFVLVSIAVRQWFLGWELAWKQLLPTLFLFPLVWWFVVGRQPKPRLWRGIVGGALAGLATQGTESIPMIWDLVSRRGTYKGDEGFGAMVALAASFLICVCATTLGGLVGLLAVVVQRRTDGGATKRVS